MNPINYTSFLTTESPLTAQMRGFNAQEAMNDAARQNKLKEIELVQQQAAFAQKQAMISDLASFSSLEKPTGAQYASLMVKYPALSDHFKKAYDVLSGEQKQSALNQSVQVYSALMSGRPDIAQNILQAQEEGYKNVGDAQSAQGMQQLRQLIATNPKEATFTAARSVAALSGAENMAKILEGTDRQIRDSETAPLKTRQTQAEVIAAENKALASQYEPSKAAAEAKKAGYLAQAEAYTPQIKQSEAQLKGYEATNAPVKNRIDNAYTEAKTADLSRQATERAIRLGLDKDKIMADIEAKRVELNTTNLDADARKLINTSISNSATARQASDKYTELANKFDQLSRFGGVFSRGKEALLATVGGQTEQTKLRQDYILARNQDVLKLLPPGSTSEFEYKVALGSYPPEDADTSYLSKWLNGMAQANKMISIAENAKADWVNEVGHLGKAKKSISIGGKTYAAGKTFPEFLDETIQASKKSSEATQAPQPGMSFMKYAKGK